MTRALVLMGLVLGLCAQSGLVMGQSLDLSDAEDALRATRKVQCSLIDGTPTILTWGGKAFSRVPGEPDRHLFSFEGYSTRSCKTYQDESRGYGYRVVAREIVLYLDPQTGDVLRTWTNPWTGADVEIIHTANDPMAPPFPFYARGKDGTGHQFEGDFNGDKVWVTSEKILFYDNPLGGDYQDYVGGKYHVTEAFNFFMNRQELLSSETDEVMDLTMSYMRVGPWMPWMGMGRRTGLMIFHGAGRKVAGYEDLSQRMKDEVAANYPAFRQPPPLDDNRPMTNSWKNFKRLVDDRRAGETQDDARGDQE